MRNKRNLWDGAQPPSHQSLRDHIRSDLERLGMAAQASETLARRLESTAAELSDDDVPGIALEDAADVERLMEGVREEMQKLDEGLRMLAAYVSRLRERTAIAHPQTLH